MPRRSWLQQWKGSWTPTYRLGTAVVVNAVSGYTVAGYDYANRKYRVLKIVVDPPSRSDLMVSESAVALP